MNQTTKHEAQAQPSVETIQELLRRAEDGCLDRSELPALRELLDDNPEFWQRYADLGAQTEAALISLASGNNVLLAESLARQLSARRAELEGPAPSSLERALAATICLSWLQQNHLARLLCHTQDASARHVRDLTRRHDTAHRQYLAGIRALMSVRQHLKPPARGPRLRLHG